MPAGFAKLIKNSEQNVQLPDRAQPVGNPAQTPPDLIEDVRIQL
jgi:hypothetical protein